MFIGVLCDKKNIATAKKTFDRRAAGGYTPNRIKRDTTQEDMKMNTQTATTATLADLLWDAVAAATLGQIAAAHRRDLDRAIVALRIGTRDGDAATAEGALATLAAIGADTSRIAPIVDRMLEGR